MNRLTTLTLIAVLGMPGTVLALDWEALWRSPDQRAADRMAREDYAGAAETFRDPHWRAAARYRAGDYADAAEAWAGLDDTRAHYNRGNALARAGDIEAAKAAYETVLEREPDHADARHNLDLLRALADEPGESGPSDDGESGQSDNGESGEGGEQEAGGDQNRGDEPAGNQEAPGDGADQPADRLADDAGELGGSEGRDDQSMNDPGEDTGAQTGGPADRTGDEANGTRAAAGPDSDATPPEAQAAMDQWLRRIPDDPGGLLRRKLLYQYSRRDRGDGEVDPW